MVLDWYLVLRLDRLVVVDRKEGNERCKHLPVFRENEPRQRGAASNQPWQPEFRQLLRQDAVSKEKA